MHSDSKKPNEAQQKKLCYMLHLALTEIRQLTNTGHERQASDLAGAFHNLPQEIWTDYFSISYFRQAFLNSYYRNWPNRSPLDYLLLFDEVEQLA